MVDKLTSSTATQRWQGRYSVMQCYVMDEALIAAFVSRCHGRWSPATSGAVIQ